jgi:hypothetical protein
VVDIIEVIIDSPTPGQYCGKVKDREFIQLQLSPIWVQLKLPAIDAVNEDISDLELFVKKKELPYD